MSVCVCVCERAGVCVCTVCPRPLHLISRNLFCSDSSNKVGNDTPL